MIGSPVTSQRAKHPGHVGCGAPEENVAQVEPRWAFTWHGAEIGRTRTAVYDRSHATPQNMEDPAVRKNAPALPDPPWVFAVAGLLASLSIGFVAALASYLASLIIPGSVVAPLVPWMAYAVAAAALIVSRIAVAGDQKRRLPWPFALGTLSGLALFASYYWPA